MAEDVDRRTIDLDRLTIGEGSLWSRLPLIGAAIGGLGVVASALLAGADPEQFYFSWLVAFLFFISLAVGALFFVLIHYVTKAGWGVVVRRLAENVASTIPLFFLLFIPIYLGLHELYHWSHADAAAHDAVLAGKSRYLNVGFFSLRTAIYLSCWSLIALFYLRGSGKQDQSGDEAISRSMTKWSGPALYVCALTVTFAAFDWIMSLDPHWYSTMYGVYFFAGCLVGFFAFIILLSAALDRPGLLKHVVSVEHFHDLGKLLFAFTVFWAYIAFAQYFLIWYANIPEETIWYMHRAEGSWRQISIMLCWGHFGLPFLFLMPRTIKRRTPFLVLGASWMLLMHLVDLYWQVMPVLHPEGVRVTLLDLTTLLAVGGLFLGLVGWLLRRQSLVPVGDPRLVESLSFENI